MRNNNIKGKTALKLIGLITVAVCAARWMPHPPNFTPLVGAAIFGSALVFSRIKAVLAPVFALWISDLFLNNLVFAQYFEGFTLFSEHFIWSAAALTVIALLARYLQQNQSIAKIAGITISSSIIFFLISNFGVWAAASSVFSPDLTGLITTYTAGLPFLLNGMLGDLFYSALFFASYYWVTKNSVSLA